MASQFKNLLSGEEKCNFLLQEKIDYFYKPYERKTDAGVPISIKYDSTSPNSRMKFLNFSENSKFNWKSISKQVLDTTKDGFKDLIKAVNSEFYNNIRKASALSSAPQTSRKDLCLSMKLFNKAIQKNFKKAEPEKPGQKFIENNKFTLTKKSVTPLMEMIQDLK